jgi:hypothetical protein
MGIEASYRRINAAEWDQLQQLRQSSPPLDGFDLYEAYAGIADSDELRSSDRYLTIDKDWHATQRRLRTRQEGGDGDLRFVTISDGRQS